MITIWSWDSCPTCQHAKFFLEESGIPFQEKRLGFDYTIKDLKQATGKAELPQFSIGDKYIGDYQYVANNIEKIKEML
jgi:glutaredoxin